MPWFKIDDSFHGHPKVERAGNAAVGLWVRCCTYSAQYLTDGHIDEAVARRYGSAREIERGVDAGLWVRNGNSELFVPDYLEYNPSAEQVRVERAHARERQARRRRDNDGIFA